MPSSPSASTAKVSSMYLLSSVEMAGWRAGVSLTVRNHSTTQTRLLNL